MKLEKIPKNMGNVLAKTVENSIYSEMKAAGLLMKTLTLFHSKICSVF